MKKLSIYLFSWVFTILISFPLHSQGLYVKINAGYGLPSGTQNLDDYNNYNYINIGGDYGENIVERVNFSLGHGINLGGNVGFMFNSNLGVDLGLSYLVGGKTETRYYSNNELWWGTYIQDIKSKSSATMLRVAPSFILVADLLKINPYARFGAVIGKGKITQDISDYFFQDYNGISEETRELTFEFTDGTSFGFTAGIGALYNIAGNISVYGELSLISMNYAPEKRMTVKYLLDGVDTLNELSRYEKETLYLDKVNYYSEPPEDEPRRRLKQKLPFGSFGINFGIRIGL